MARAYSKMTMPGFITQTVKECLREHEMDWPPLGPDLTPIESFWDVLAKALCSDPTLPSSIQDLAKRLMQH